MYAKDTVNSTSAYLSIKAQEASIIQRIAVPQSGYR